MTSLSVTIFRKYIKTLKLFLCLLTGVGWHREIGLSPPVKYFTDRSKAVLLLWIFYAFSVLCLRCICALLFICTLWSPPEKGLCGSTKCSPTQYAPFSSILCALHTQYAPLEHFVYPAYTICYQWSILCRVGTYVISVVVRGYTICSS